MSVTKNLSLLCIWAIASASGLVLSVMETNPLALGPMGVTLWFVVLFASASAVACLGLFAAKSFLHVHPTRVQRLRYSRRQGLEVGGWITAMLCLSSLRQLGGLDAILLALLLVIVETYMRLRWP